MLIFMAVGTKELPVAAIIGIVLEIVVLVVDGEFLEALARELALASPAYMRK